MLAYAGSVGIIDFDAMRVVRFSSSLENGVTFISLSADETKAVGGNGGDLQFEVFDATNGSSLTTIGPTG